jgi:hypothetical protein
MAEALLRKLPNGALIPDDEESATLVQSYKVGQPIRCVVTKMRNYKFHKKWFALVKYAFDIWSESAPPIRHKGEAVRPNFDKFRRDLTILAGFYEPVFGVRGELMLEAKSISFANMDDHEFESLFSATLDAVLQKVLSGRGLTEAKLREYVDEVMRFDR